MGYVSVKKAAKLLLVSESTIHKWIGEGKLHSKKGLIDRSCVRDLLTSEEGLIDEIINGTRPSVPCWEYYASSGEVKEDCLACPIFEKKESRCFQVGKYLKESGRGASCCPTDCEDCSYYKEHKEMATERASLLFEDAAPPDASDAPQ
jgi:hypothetical protein